MTWWANLGAFSILYLCAGLFWNLDWQPGRGVTSAFMEQLWPSPSGGAPFTRVAWPALLLVLMISLHHFAPLSLMTPRQGKPATPLLMAGTV